MKVSTILDQHVNRLSETVEKYPFEDLRHYQMWSSQHYYLIQHTPRLLHLCCGVLEPSERELSVEFSHHLKEEMNHDTLIERDMAHFNYNLLSSPPSPPTLAMIELQKHFIMAHGPVVFLGYGLVLEGMAIKIGGRVAERLATAHGVRSKFLDVHSHSDETHYPEGLERVDRFLVDERSKTAFVTNLVTTCFNYSEIMSWCLRTAKEQSVLKPHPELTV